MSEPPLPPAVPSPADPTPGVPPERRPSRARTVGLALIGLTLAVLIGVAWFVDRTNDAIDRTFAIQTRWVAQAERAFTEIPLLDDAEVRELRRSRNARHVALGQELGVPPPDTRAEAESLATALDLVTIETNPLYTVLPGEHSVPLLTPSAAATLDSIAVRFRERLSAMGLPPFRFAVSSVWRTADDQAALRGGNVNAAAGRSSHEYATTYDITYNPTRYSPAPDALPPPPRIDPGVPGFLEGRVRDALVREQAADLDRLALDYSSRLTAVLGRVLIELEDEGVLAVVRERRQPVYHVTVADRVAASP